MNLYFSSLRAIFVYLMFNICKGLQMVTMSYKSAKSRKIFFLKCWSLFLYYCNLLLSTQTLYLFICLISSEKIEN